MVHQRADGRGILHLGIIELQHLIQGLESAVVHVGRGFGDVAQRRGTVGTAIARVARDAGTGVLVCWLRIQPVVVEEVGGEHRAAATTVAVEAVGTLLGGEEDVAMQFLRGELLLAAQVAVKFGVSGD